ncbi:MAG TPA: YvcK family protein [Anaerolineae bacterium]|nr:YvcK family protein [Anaerolineae bacterium]
MKSGGTQAGSAGWHTHLKWLQPGLGVKRWLLLLTFGMGLLSLGGAMAFRDFYPLPVYFYYLTLQFLPREMRVLLCLGLGLGCIGLGLWGLNRAILEPFVNNVNGSIRDVLYDFRRRGRGPKIVVIGGGHGQATVLRGLKSYTSNLTAIVTVADDGGSSGRLRRDLGILPPGDFRNCIAALADDESLVARLFQYRFAGGAELGGHSFGNLFIGAMSGITGSFEAALRESSRVLAVQGSVIPSTLEVVTLCADIEKDGMPVTRVRGESAIPEVRGRILRVLLEPATPRAYPEAVRAILEADLVVVGPGSLYTSILPNLLAPEIVAALRAARASKVYICNVATQVGETEAYTARDHFEALVQHVGDDVITIAVVNDRLPDIQLPPDVTWVYPDLTQHAKARVIHADLVDEAWGWRHASDKLAQVVIGLLHKEFS